jgi:hypothetical protein
VNPMHALAGFLAQLTHPSDASAEQDGHQHEDADGCANELACAEDRLAPPSALDQIQPIDLQAKAAGARYKSGKAKRTAFAPVDLARREVVIGLHQMGVELPASWPSWWKVTCHVVIRTDGVPLILHPVRTRLTATNRVDRPRFHCVAIEFAVNAEGVDGSGRWALPERNGRGRISDAQVAGGLWACRWIVGEVAANGGTVRGVLPHVTTGRDSRGRPNRQICPGSRIWSEVGERAAVELELAIPGPTWKAGGLVLPQAWHGRYHAEAATRLLAAA